MLTRYAAFGWSAVVKSSQSRPPPPSSTYFPVDIPHDSKQQTHRTDYSIEEGSHKQAPPNQVSSELVPSDPRNGNIIYSTSDTVRCAVNAASHFRVRPQTTPPSSMEQAAGRRQRSATGKFTDGAVHDPHTFMELWNPCYPPCLKSLPRL